MSVDEIIENKFYKLNGRESLPERLSKTMILE